MTGKPRVAIYYGGFLHRTGGAFMHVRMIAPELEKLGYTVDIVTLDSLPVPLRYLPHLVERTVNVFMPPLGYLYKGALTRFLFSLFARRCDLRIFEDIYLAWNSEVPSITVLHALWSDNLQAWSVPASAVSRLIRREATILRRTRHPVVTVSAPYHRYLVDKHLRGEQVPRIHVIPLGIDLSRFPQPGPRAGARRSLVYVGALEARKNVNLLLRVFDSLWRMDRSYQMTIIGNGPDGPALEKFCAARSLPVRFLGRLDHTQVVEELAKHDILVHTSTKESFSFALLEAKLCGLQTCAYAELQVPDEFIDAKVPTFEPSDWCAAIRDMDGAVSRFQAEAYSSRNMALATLELLEGRRHAKPGPTPVRTG